jgi:hypothetical protein
MKFIHGFILQTWGGLEMTNRFINEIKVNFTISRSLEKYQLKKSDFLLIKGIASSAIVLSCNSCNAESMKLHPTAMNRTRGYEINLNG